MSLHSAGNLSAVDAVPGTFHHLLNTPLPLAFVDDDARILAVNANFANLLNYETSECAGKLLFGPGIKAGPDACNTAQFAESLLSGQPFTTTIEVCTEPLRWLQLQFTPLTADSALNGQVMVTATDVTAMHLTLCELQSVRQAIDKSRAVIEFDLKGYVVSANDQFLQIFGYQLDEIKGRHHRMFCDPAEAATTEYLAFWERLRLGEFQAGQYCRISKEGKEIWIQATYNPIISPDGKPYKIVKFASDISRERLLQTETHGKMDALNRSQAIIEFDLQGNILHANSNFLRSLGYTETEVIGKHHSMFCEQQYVHSAEYRNFWADLGEGKFKSDRYKRLAKHGAEVWIQATYNPILDRHGRAYKIVKFAVDVTEQVKLEQAIHEKIRDMISVLQNLTR